MTTTTTTPPKSTTDRLVVRARLIGLRLAFGLLDRIAPTFAARWAVDIWCTVPASRNRRDGRPTGGVRSDLTTVHGHRLAVEVWGDGPPVYLAHGWGGWRGQMGAFVAPIVAAGFRVISFDAPSHGDSGPGELGEGRSSAAEFAQALAIVIDAHGAASCVVAHSLGGTAAGLAARDGAPVTALALVAASADPIRLTDALAETLGYGDRTRRRFRARLEMLAGRPLSEFDISTSDAAATRALIVHDRQDKEVPYADSVRLAAAWPEVEFVSTTGLGHQRILKDPAVIDLVCSFVAAGR